MAIDPISAGVTIANAGVGIAGGITDIVQKAKLNKQRRKQEDKDFNERHNQNEFMNSAERRDVSEGFNKDELVGSDAGDSLYGRWTNESRDYNKYKNQVEDGLRKSGAIRDEKYKSGKKTKTRTVYDKDFDNFQGAAYDKIAGYNMTRDQNNRLIGGQKWEDVTKNDEAIIAGERETKRKAYGVSGNASVSNIYR